MHPYVSHQPQLQPVTDHECEQIDGGSAIEAMVSAGIEALELVLYCVVAGQACFA
jgi:hypothetical protein